MSLQKRPINSEKQIVTSTNLLIAGGAGVTQTIVNTVNDYVGTVGTVPVGATIPWFFVELNLNNEGNITQTLSWYIAKIPNNAFTPPSATDPGGSVFKKNIFKVGMEMPAGINNSSSVKRIFVLKVPKGFQRCGENDQWIIKTDPSTTGTYDVCSKVVYKRFS